MTIKIEDQRRKEFGDLRAVVGGNQDAIALVSVYETEGKSAGEAALALVDRAIIATSEAALRDAWDGYPDIRSEFGTFETFSAYRRAAARGGAKQHRGQVTSRN